MTEFFYNKTEFAFADTRVVHRSPTVFFLGEEPRIFKPGMPFNGHLRVRP